MSASFTITVAELAVPLAAGSNRGADGLSFRGSFPPLLAEVWRLEAGRLAALAAGMGLAREAAADVLQEVYLRALRCPPPLDRRTGDERASAVAAGDCPREQLVRWLFRVTANECRQAQRRTGRRQRLWSSLAAGTSAASDSENGLAAGAIESLQFAELRRDVNAALVRLDEHDRLLVVLRYFLNWNSRQIAELTNEPESTIRGRLRACRLRLASELGEWNDAK